jgi:hypothetical protein
LIPFPYPTTTYTFWESCPITTPEALVGRHVLRNFGKHGVHKGTISSYDDDGELTFRVDYLDGDFEDLSEEHVLATIIPLPNGALLVDNSGVRVTARRRRAKHKDDSDSEFVVDNETTSDADIEPINSQAPTQPLEDPGLINDSQQGAVLLAPTPIPLVRRRITPSTRQSSASSVWVPSTCPSCVCVHYNAVDRGLCAQTLREHHVVLERAMARIFPRFKWGRSHYLQVPTRVLYHQLPFTMIFKLP